LTLNEIYELRQGTRVQYIGPTSVPWDPLSYFLPRHAFSALVALRRPNYTTTAVKTGDGREYDMTINPQDWERIDERL